MDTLKVAVGSLFLFTSSVTTIQLGLTSARAPFVAAAIGSVVIALGSIALGSDTDAASI